MRLEAKADVQDSPLPIRVQARTAMLVVGALFVAAGIAEGILVAAAALASLVYRHPDPIQFAILLVLAAACAAATAGFGRVFIEDAAPRTVAKPGNTSPLTEARAVISLVIGITGLILFYPLGVILGPTAFLIGKSAIRRIGRTSEAVNGGAIAKTGMVLGALISTLYLLWILADVAMIFATGQPFPAPD